MFSYKTKGVCAREIQFELEDDIVRNVRVIGGCPGNAQGLSILASDMKADDLITKLEGIRCGMRATSCPDQLVQAIKERL